MMLRPMLAIAGMMIVVGISMCVIERSYVHVAASGLPFDHPGPRMKCMVCSQGVGVWQKHGYNYQCEQCGAKYRCRWNDTTAEFETDW